MSDNYRLNYRGLQTYDRCLKQYIQDSLPQVMSGASNFHDGTSGLTPLPLVGQQNKYLKGDGTWSDIPSFISLYNINEESITIEQNETEISFIECNLTKKVDLEGHFTMSFFATEDCDLYIRIKDDNVEEIFVPQVYSISKGYYSIGIPHAYLGKQIGLHNFTVTAQCSNGEITIPNGSLLYTIFGAIDDSYLNKGIDIIDLSIKKTIADSSPSEIWSMGFNQDEEISELILRKNDYNNPNDNRWTDVHNFGQVIGGALEFYGYWEISSNDRNKYDLITEDNPFVFIINNNNDLKFYSNGNYNDNESNILASNVTKVSACTGFKSHIDPSLDQGLVVAYIKNGNVYYRQWKYYNDTSNFWFAPEELYMDGDATDVQVHRLPDYRIGILVKYSNGCKWYITDRTFIGNTYKNEYIKNNFDIDNIIDIFPSSRINENLGVATINEFEEQHYHNGFIMTFEGNLRFSRNKTIDDLRNNISAYREGVQKPIRSVEIENNKLIVYTTEDIQGGANFTISWNMNEFITTNMNGCRMLITQKSYTWYLPTTTVRYEFEDEINSSINGNLNTSIRQIGNINSNFEDSCSIELDSELNCNINNITYKDNSLSDESEFSINSIFNAVVSLVGETPI